MLDEIRQNFRRKIVYLCTFLLALLMYVHVYPMLLTNYLLKYQTNARAAKQVFCSYLAYTSAKI